MRLALIGYGAIGQRIERDSIQNAAARITGSIGGNLSAEPEPDRRLPPE